MNAVLDSLDDQSRKHHQRKRKKGESGKMGSVFHLELKLAIAVVVILVFWADVVKLSASTTHFAQDVTDNALHETRTRARDEIETIGRLKQR